MERAAKRASTRSTSEVSEETMKQKEGFITHAVSPQSLSRMSDENMVTGGEQDACYVESHAGGASTAQPQSSSAFDCYEWNAQAKMVKSREAASRRASMSEPVSMESMDKVR